MAIEEFGNPKSFYAVADLSSYQYRAVKIVGDSAVNLCGDGEFAVGILQDAPVADRVCSVSTRDISKAVYGATVTAGQKLASDSVGRLIPAVSGKHVTAQAMEDGAVNEIHSVLIEKVGVAPTPYV